MPDYDPVISNTSPLFYLEQINQIDLLPALFSRLVVPSAVIAELAAGAAQGERVPKLERFSWVEVSRVTISESLRAHKNLDKGELEAIALALKSPNPLLLLDDHAARQMAAWNRIKFTGTFGILLRAKFPGLIPALAPLLDQLQAAGFRLSNRVKSNTLELGGES